MSIINPKPLQTLWQADSEAAMMALAPVLYEDGSPCRCITLQGPLGVGKSVFARALIRHLAQNPTLEIPSPTFTLLQTYDTPQGPVWHYDLYRLGDAAEIYELGWEEALQSALILIEWPERLGPLLPQQRMDIVITPDKDKPNLRHLYVRTIHHA